MKKVLLTLLIVAGLAASKSYAQPCELSNLNISIAPSSTPGMCSVNVTFDMEHNPGNKFVYVHIWRNDDYAMVDQSKFSKTAGPKKAEIYGATNQHAPVATIGIYQFKTDPPKRLGNGEYKPDPTNVPLNNTGTLTVTALGGKMYRYTITGMQVSTPAGGCQNVCGIVWSTQANSANSHIHCSAACKVNSTTNVAVRGSANCTTASFTLTLQNMGNTGITATSVDIYADNGGSPNDGIFDPGNGGNRDNQFHTTSNIAVAANSTVNYNGTIPAAYLGYDLWAQVEFSNGSTLLALIPTSACGALPIKLQSFDASRMKQNVTVKWATAGEQDVRGFNVQRLSEEGSWKTVAFVPSQASNGSSASVLSYQYVDLNTYRGVSQYRIQEVAKDGKIGLSDVRMVRGEEQSGKMILYPNPSTDGKVNLVFDAQSSRDITISDMSGRVVKQVRGVSASSISIDNLKTGFYSVQVVDRTTNESSVEKLIIKMR